MREHRQIGPMRRRRRCVKICFDLPLWQGFALAERGLVCRRLTDQSAIKLFVVRGDAISCSVLDGSGDVFNMFLVKYYWNELCVSGTSAINMSTNQGPFPRGSETYPGSFLARHPAMVCLCANYENKLRLFNFPICPLRPALGWRGFVLV
jgi:hypothetical protein